MQACTYDTAPHPTSSRISTTRLSLEQRKVFRTIFESISLGASDRWTRDFPHMRVHSAYGMVARQSS